MMTLKEKLYTYFLILLLLGLAVLYMMKSAWLEPMEIAVWLFLLLDIGFEWYRAPNKILFLIHHPFDFLSILPVHIFFRFLKLIPLTSRLLRNSEHINVEDTDRLGAFLNSQKSRWISYFIVIFLILPLPVLVFEPHINTYEKLLWWEIQTVTTVGYGDITPETGIGKLIAGILMILGVALISLITSKITRIMSQDAMKVEAQQQQSQAKIQETEFTYEELKKLESLIQEELRRKKRNHKP